MTSQQHQNSGAKIQIYTAPMLFKVVGASTHIFSIFAPVIHENMSENGNFYSKNCLNFSIILVKTVSVKVTIINRTTGAS